MHFGEILVARGLVSVADMAAAHARHRTASTRLSDVLIDMRLLSPADLLDAQIQATTTAPMQPRTLADTGVSIANLLGLMLRLMSLETRETAADIMQALKLPYAIVERLLDEARNRSWIQAIGMGLTGNAVEPRYTLSQEGRSALADAMAQSLYMGPAPVPLEAFQAQIQRQRLVSERLDATRLRAGLGGLAVPDHFLRKLLPAINAGSSILLFGPPGNGKTSVASRISALFRDVIFIPYAVEIAGQVMRVFDPGLHVPVLSDEDRASLGNEGLTSVAFDDRFALCRRPFAIAGGELTLEMLDLQFDTHTKFYDAPLHVKALGGVFLIDDFGRQRMNPKELLNRWIVPMESRVDYLKLHSGKSFSFPFDELLIFSTNIDPRDIMDPALLRRIPYKIKLFAPDMAEYRAIFATEAESRGLTLEEGVVEYAASLLTEQGDFGLAYFQPKFICQQVAEVCELFGFAPVVTRALTAEALSNLYVQIADLAGT